MTDMCALLTDYHCMVKVKAEMDQFLEGLDIAGVAVNVKSQPHIMKPAFQYVPHETVTSGSHYIGGLFYRRFPHSL